MFVLCKHKHLLAIEVIKGNNQADSAELHSFRVSCPKDNEIIIGRGLC